MRRHDLLEKKLDRAENNLSSKAEAKATVQREVRDSLVFSCVFAL